jgi:hypothetical protein
MSRSKNSGETMPPGTASPLLTTDNVRPSATPSARRVGNFTIAAFAFAFLVNFVKVPVFHRLRIA